MAKPFKVTSDPFYINGNITMDVANTYKQIQISSPLDSLNREGLLVHAVYWTSSTPELIAAAQSRVLMQLTATSKAALVGVNDANVLSLREVQITGGALEFSGPHVIDIVQNTDSWDEDSRLGIVATDDLFLGIDTTAHAGLGSCQFRAVCSRIQLTSSAYAALVTNELSS